MYMYVQTINTGAAAANAASNGADDNNNDDDTRITLMSLIFD